METSGKAHCGQDFWGDSMATISHLGIHLLFQTIMDHHYHEVGTPIAHITKQEQATSTRANHNGTQMHATGQPHLHVHQETRVRLHSNILKHAVIRVCGAARRTAPAIHEVRHHRWNRPQSGSLAGSYVPFARVCRTSFPQRHVSDQRCQ